MGKARKTGRLFSGAAILCVFEVVVIKHSMNEQHQKYKNTSGRVGPKLSFLEPFERVFHFLLFRLTAPYDCVII